jgi:GGDEF domain-containing protein
MTASVGTASAELHMLCTVDGGHLIDELIALADSAMYAAKRRGGNQAHQSTGS